MTVELKLWLVRHARPLVEEGLCYGASDLTADRQATIRAARKLARALPVDVRLRSSPLRRCACLAQELCKLRPDIEVVFDPRLKELDFGAWELMKWSDIPRAQLDLWAQRFGDFRVGGAESVQTLLDRVVHVLVQECDGGFEKRDSVWITHAGVIRAVHYLARYGLCRLSASDWSTEQIPYGSWKAVTIAKIRPLVGNVAGLLREWSLTT